MPRYAARMVSTASLHHIRLFYAAYFAAMGLILPFFPVYLRHLGLDLVAVGLMTGLLASAKVIAPPLLGHWLDRSERDSRRFLIVASLAASLFALLFGSVAAHVWLLAVMVFLFGVLWAAVLPMTDGLSVSVAEENFTDYGRLRVWGSVGFVLASLAGGIWLSGADMAHFPWWLAGLMLVTAVAASGFPSMRRHLSRGDGGEKGLPRSLLFLLAAGFIMQLSHGAYYGFFSLYLIDHGYVGWQVGAFWVLGVVAEIVLMWQWSRPLQQAAPATVMGICFLLAALRWGGIGFSSALWLLILLQLLHAATFAAFHISAVTWVKRLAPAHRHTAAQGWYSAMGFGLGNTVGIMACGLLVDRFGYALAFYACALVALAGVAVSRGVVTSKA